MVAAMTTRNGGFLLPRSLIRELADETPEALSSLEVWPDGSCIELETSDIHISVHGLLSHLVPAMIPPALQPNAAPTKGASAPTGSSKRSKPPSPSTVIEHVGPHGAPHASRPRSRRKAG